jgi:hypothetical protein
MESINPVDNLVGMPRNATKAQDSQPERREDSKYAVEVTSLTRLASLLWCGECAGHGLCIRHCLPQRLPRFGACGDNRHDARSARSRASARAGSR